MKAPFGRKIFLLSILLVSAALLSIIKGAVNIPLAELLSAANHRILMLRLMRLLLATVAGSGLAVSGIALQAVLRNPLAEPYLLGTSSGAGLGAVIAIVLGVSGIYLPFAAFSGAILSIIAVYAISRQGNKIPVQSLILSGVVVSIALSGIVIFLVTISSNEALHGLAWWLWGSLQVYDLKLIFMVAAAVVLGISAVFVLAQDLNAISIGEEEALHLGINAETIKKILFVITSMITASIVCISGAIGFVGLIIPHIMRFVVGPNHKILIPASCIAGAAFMIICDVVSRTLFPPLEIPIGVITALIGAPAFIILLKRRQKI
jgi:iron complex transport system permease protein